MSDDAQARTYIDAFWVRAALRGSPEGAARKLPAILVDAALIGSSLVAAAGAIAFAGSMLIEGDHRPKVNGLKYLAIFAQPHGAARPAQAVAPALPRATPAAGPIDMTPFGSISGLAPPRDADGAAAPAFVGAAAPSDPAGYSLVAAQSGLAWLRQGMLMLAVRPGDEIPGVGRVQEIAQREGHWALIGAGGRPLLAGGATGANDPSRTHSRFARPMIFDADN